MTDTTLSLYVAVLLRLSLCVSIWLSCCKKKHQNVHFYIFSVPNVPFYKLAHVPYKQHSILL